MDKLLSFSFLKHGRWSFHSQREPLCYRQQLRSVADLKKEKGCDEGLSYIRWHFQNKSLLIVQIVPISTTRLSWRRRKIGLVLEQRNNDQRGETKNKYKEYYSKQASIHTVAVVSRGGWNGVKQQNQRADSAEKKAAKENEASVQ